MTTWQTLLREELHQLDVKGDAGDIFAATKARMARLLIDRLSDVLRADNRYALNCAAGASNYLGEVLKAADKLFEAPKPAGSEGWHPDDIDRPNHR